MSEVVDRRSPNYVRVFQQVTQIEAPGDYRFALNQGPDRLQSPHDTLPDHTPVNDNVLGSRPRWETDIAANLLETFPRIQVIDLSGRQVVRRRWFRESSTIYLPPNYYCRYFVGERGGDEADSLTINLDDTGEPVIPKGKLGYTKGEGEFDGNLQILLDGDAGRRDDRGAYWRGTLVLKGKRPGIFVESAIKYINQIISERQIPLWKQV